MGGASPRRGERAEGRKAEESLVMATGLVSTLEVFDWSVGACKIGGGGLTVKCFSSFPPPIRDCPNLEGIFAKTIGARTDSDGGWDRFAESPHEGGKKTARNCSPLRDTDVTLRGKKIGFLLSFPSTPLFLDVPPRV